MNINKIDLPLDELIDSQHLAHEIANSICPTGEDENGINCVIGKITPFSGFKNGIPTSLSNEDIKLLKTILPDLPGLHGKISRKEKIEFINAYRKHPLRPKWYPLIIDEDHISTNKNKQHNLYIEHHKELQNAFSKGEINAVDSEHKSVKFLGSGTYIPRTEVINYLKKIGLAVNPKKQNIAAKTRLPFTDKQHSISKDLKIEKLNLKADIIDVDDANVLYETNVRNDSPTPKKQTRTRRDVLTPLIEEAQVLAKTPYDAAEIWLILLRFAKEMRPPITGFGPEGIKWEGGSELKEKLTIRALRQRLDRKKTKIGR